MQKNICLFKPLGYSSFEYSATLFNLEQLATRCNTAF